MSSGVVGEEAGAGSGAENSFAHPRKLACCATGLGLGAATGFAGGNTSAGAVAAGRAATVARGICGNCCGLPATCCPAFAGGTKTKLGDLDATRRDESVAGELDLEDPAVVVPRPAGSPAAKRSNRRRSAASAAAAAADSSALGVLPSSETADVVSEPGRRLDAARPQTLCAGSADACCCSCCCRGGGIGIAVVVRAAAGRCTTVAGGGRAAPKPGLGGGGLERMCGRVEKAGGCACGGVLGCGTSA
jgi:hypothetical protein